MFLKETKIVLIWSLIGLALLAIPGFGLAQTFSSTNFAVSNPVVDSGQQNSSSSNFGLGQSFSQIAIGKSTSTDFQLWSGFQYFFQVNPDTLTATPGDSQVSLNWTVPQTFLGVSVGNYELGTGTVSGSYTFQSVGNITSFVKTGLTNGTQYFFIIKAETAAGEFLVFSNEANATPNGSTPPPPPPANGGSGGAETGTLVASGTAYPGAAVTILENAIISGSTIADSQGHFQFTLQSINPGSYSFIVYATDTTGIKSANLNFQATITQTVSTTVINLDIAPTITTDQSVVKQGDSLAVSGFAPPSVPLTITLSSQSNQTSTFHANSDIGGKYSYTLPTANLDLGDYGLISNYVLGQPSPDSLPTNFTVSNRSVPRQPQTCGSRSDLNCDGHVNLIDFSILLYYWNGDADISKNPRVDIDHSGKVDIQDFSIMLYDWTG